MITLLTILFAAFICVLALSVKHIRKLIRQEKETKKEIAFWQMVKALNTDASL